MESPQKSTLQNAASLNRFCCWEPWLEAPLECVFVNLKINVKPLESNKDKRTLIVSFPVKPKKEGTGGSS